MAFLGRGVDAQTLTGSDDDSSQSSGRYSLIQPGQCSSEGQGLQIVMFRNTFQSGFLSILYSLGSKPLEIWQGEGRSSIFPDLLALFRGYRDAQMTDLRLCEGACL